MQELPANTSNINTYWYPETQSDFFKSFIGRQDEARPPSDTTSLDTLFIKQTSVKLHTTYRTSLLNNLQGQVFGEPVPYKSMGSNWLTLILIAGLLLYSLIHRNMYKKVGMIFKAFFNHRHTTPLVREGNIYNEPGFYVLLFISFVSLSVTLFSVSSTTVPRMEEHYLLFMQIFAGLVIYYFGKILFLMILSNVFYLEKLLQEYILTQHIFFIVLGVLLVFLSPIYVYIGGLYMYLIVVLAMVSFFIYFLFRLYYVVLANGFFSGIHFFLYICTVEIFPLIIIYKSYK